MPLSRNALGAEQAGLPVWALCLGRPCTREASPARQKVPLWCPGWAQAGSAIQTELPLPVSPPLGCSLTSHHLGELDQPPRGGEGIDVDEVCLEISRPVSP